MFSTRSALLAALAAITGLEGAKVKAALWCSGCCVRERAACAFGECAAAMGENAMAECQKARAVPIGAFVQPDRLQWISARGAAARQQCLTCAACAGICRACLAGAEGRHCAANELQRRRAGAACRTRGWCI